jgi:DNA-binding transcriptional LysR family regulator
VRDNHHRCDSKRSQASEKTSDQGEGADEFGRNRGRKSALRKGEIDVALIGQEGRVLVREFNTKKLTTLSVLAATLSDHRLASRKQIRLVDLRKEPFIGSPEGSMPRPT